MAGLHEYNTRICCQCGSAKITAMGTILNTATEPKPKPLKRNKHLVSLSREHHTGLLFGWKIKQGLSKQVPLKVLLNYLRFFWESHLREHFAQEENELNSLLPLHDPMRVAVEEDHRILEEKIKRLLSGKVATEAEFLALADFLTAHIRFEERDFFPYLEQHLTAEQLAKIGLSLHPLKPEKEEDFKPAFWLRDYAGQAA